MTNINGIKKIANNAISLLTSDIFNRAATFGIYIMVARYLGTFVFGQLSLALTLFYVFQVISIGGLSTYITREIAKDKANTGLYLVNAGFIVISFSFVSYILLVLFIWIMGYSYNTALIIFLVSLGLIPFSLSAICESVFKGVEKMQYIPIAQIPTNTFKVLLAFVLLFLDFGIYQLVSAILIIHFVILSIELWIITRRITKVHFNINFKFSINMIKKTITFLAIDTVIALWSSINIIILSKLTGEVEVGLFSAASQLMVPLSLIIHSLIASIFPIMCRKYSDKTEIITKISTNLNETLFAIAIPIVVGLFFFAKPALMILYADKDFQLASNALQIMLGGLIVNALSESLGNLLLASFNEKLNLKILIINLVSSLIFGIILIYYFGIIGAAINALLMGVINLIQHYVAVHRLFDYKLHLIRIIWKPLFASLCMTIYLMLVEKKGLLVSIIPGGLIYFVILSLLILFSIGGFRQFKEKFLYETLD